MNYAIITPAYNESRYIALTLESVLRQTILPKVWIIVDDGSTDDTAKIITQYTKQYPWIKYLYRSKIPGQTYFGSNVYAIQEGFKIIEEIGFDYLAILDADIALCSDYYEKIISQFDKMSQLGIASGIYYDNYNDHRVLAMIDENSTPKAIQVFKKECFIQIGGYIPFKYGGEDSGTEIMARMKGWITKSFHDIRVIHNRPLGLGASRSLYRARFRRGLAEYTLGTHPLFLLCKYIRRAFYERPYIIGSFASLIGYGYAAFKAVPRQLPEDAICYIRKEQLGRLKKTLFWKR